MAEETLKVTITADNKSAIEGLKQVSSATQSFVTQQGKLVTGSNQAAQALTNVGRVAQDLPFGFIGIQNNLNPLLESFQRLKAETGTTQGALKALGSSLIGAGGIGLALSVASSAFLLFGDRLFDTGKKAEATKKAFDDITAGIAKDAANITQLVEKYKDTNLTLGQRKTILEELNKISPEYFNGLNKETTSYKELTKASDAYIASLTKQVQLKVLQAQYEKNVDKLLQNQVENEKVKALQAEFAIKNRTKLDAVGLPQNAKLEKENKLLLNQIAALTVIEDKQKKIDAAKGGKGSTTTEAKQQFDTFRGKQPYADAVQIQQHLLDVQKEMLAVSKQQYEVDLKKEALIRLGKPIQEKFQGVKNDSIAQASAQQQEATQQTILGLEQSRLSAIDEMNKKFKDQAAVVQTVGNTFSNLFANIAQSDNPFETLTNSVKQLVIDLAAAAAKMFLIRALMTAINPAAGAAKGIGGILGGIISGVTPFATGGIVSKPTLGMVGEAGTEAILPLDRFQGMLSQSFQMGSLSGGGNNTQPIVLDTRIAGNDIWLSQRRTDFSRNLRTGG